VNHFYSYNSAKAETGDPSCTAQNFMCETQMITGNSQKERRSDTLSEFEERDKAFLQGCGCTYHEHDFKMHKDRDEEPNQSSVTAQDLLCKEPEDRDERLVKKCENRDEEPVQYRVTAQHLECKEPDFDQLEDNSEVPNPSSVTAQDLLCKEPEDGDERLVKKCEDRDEEPVQKSLTAQHLICIICVSSDFDQPQDRDEEPNPSSFTTNGLLLKEPEDRDERLVKKCEDRDEEPVQRSVTAKDLQCKQPEDRDERLVKKCTAKFHDQVQESHVSSCLLQGCGCIEQDERERIQQEHRGVTAHDLQCIKPEDRDERLLKRYTSEAMNPVHESYRSSCSQV